MNKSKSKSVVYIVRKEMNSGWHGSMEAWP